MNESGIVEKLVQNRAVIKIRKNAGCETCEAKGSCHAQTDREMQVEVDNDLHAKEGDAVEVSMPARSVAKMALVVYLGPVLSLIAGALAGDVVDKSPLAPVIGGGILLAASLFGVKRFERLARSRPEYHPHMTRIIRRGA